MATLIRAVGLIPPMVYVVCSSPSVMLLQLIYKFTLPLVVPMLIGTIVMLVTLKLVIYVVHVLKCDKDMPSSTGITL